MPAAVQAAKAGRHHCPHQFKRCPDASGQGLMADPEGRLGTWFRPRAGRFRDGCIGSPPTAEANGSFPCLLQVSHRQAPSSRGCSADLATGSVNAATLRARPPAGPKHLDPASATIAQTAEIGKNASLAHTSSHPAAPASAVKGLWWLLLAIPSIFRDRVTGNTLIESTFTRKHNFALSYFKCAFKLPSRSGSLFACHLKLCPSSRSKPAQVFAQRTFS